MTDRSEPRWLSEPVMLAVHDRQLGEHGGPAGVRDAGALASALARPVNRWAHGADDPSELAAAYAFGIARNHPFVDGNKRTAYSLRHTYICMRLIEGADIYALAKNCRTSVEMIQKFYAAHIKDLLDASAINIRRRRLRQASKEGASLKEPPELRAGPDT